MDKFPDSLGNIQIAVNDWEDSVERFAPDQLDNLRRLQTLVFADQASTAKKQIAEALEVLDRGLQIHPAQELVYFSSLDVDIPPVPPVGYSKILIADDNSQYFLASTLRSGYGYNVIPTQATTLIQAKNLLDEHDPDVVLADLYFKKTDTLTEVPARATGEEFQKYALRDARRLVLVTSKATIRSADLLAGTINCSGAHLATSASAIHRAIWKAAGARGVTEPEAADGQVWGPELTSRQRLEPYRKMLPRIIDQWSLFPPLIKETLNLALLLKRMARGSERALVEELIKVLQSNECRQDFSTRSIRDLFGRTKRIHERAKTGIETKIKHDFRNILHGKIEQSSSVLNAVDHVLDVTNDVAKELSHLARYNSLGNPLSGVLKDFSENADLLPFLTALNTAVVEVLDGLPPLPVRDGAQQSEGAGQTFRILVVEDSPYWRSQVSDVCEQLANNYGGHHEFIVESFDNSADALAVLEPRNTADVVAGHVGTPTIAILDICIPANQQHSQRIEDATAGRSRSFYSPESSHGLELIRTLSEFAYNIPIIVFSTIDSIDDRKKVCGWGIPEANFISKGPAAHKHLRSALIRLIERSAKYIISRHTIGEVDRDEPEEEVNGRSESPAFYINGLKITLPPALFNTFEAIYDLCQRTGERTFTVDELIDEKGYGTRKEIHDHINRIRARLFETAHRNRVYLNVHEIIRTFAVQGEVGKFGYELNAEIPTRDEEYLDPWNEDREALALRNRVLLIGNHPAFVDISAVLTKQSFEVTECKENLSSDSDVHPLDSDVVVVSTCVGDPLTQWKSIKGAASDKDVGVLFIAETTIDPVVVNELVQAGVPMNNLVSTASANWLSHFLQAFENERARVFVGDAPDLAIDHSFPIVEILDGTDLDAGILNLLVDERPFYMTPRDNGVHSKLLGQLLLCPGEILSWTELESRAALPNTPTENNRKTWPSRIRQNVIAVNWVDPFDGDPIERAKLILESSSEGLQLNVRTIDLRTGK